MDRLIILFALFTSLMEMTSCTKPHIVFILADDLVSFVVNFIVFDRQAVKYQSFLPYLILFYHRVGTMWVFMDLIKFQHQTLIG